jgi:hypothetical protein
MSNSSADLVRIAIEGQVYWTRQFGITTMTLYLDRIQERAAHIQVALLQRYQVAVTFWTPEDRFIAYLRSERFGVV